MSKGAWASLVSCIVIVGAGVASGFWIHNHAGDQLTQGPRLMTSQVETVNTSVQNQTEPKTKKEIIEASQKVVVTIESTTGLGSGFLYNNQGDLLTNAHVVEGYSEVKVRTVDHKEYKGTVIGISDDTDVAVVRVPEMKKLEPLPLASAKAETGDEVLALGSPLGLENTVTTGIISATGRSFDISHYVYSNMYQISAFITHGNSGGPLVSAVTGEVLGINSASATEEAGIGFSIPITSILKQVQDWSKNPMNTATLHDHIEGTNEVSTAEELVSYFYQAIDTGDYVSAYAVLGNQWQSGTSYEDFRKGYLNTIHVVVQNVAVTEEDLEGAKVSAIIEATERRDEGTVTQRYELQYTLKYENSVLKLQKGVGKKIK